MLPKRVVILVAFFLSQSVLATHPPKPTSCPSIAAIQMTTLTNAIKDGSAWVASNPRTNYGTALEWSLFIRVWQKVNDNNDVIQKGKANMSLIQTVAGPEIGQGNDGKERWLCGYLKDGEVIGMAVTPPSRLNMNIQF